MDTLKNSNIIIEKEVFKNIPKYDIEKVKDKTILFYARFGKIITFNRSLFFVQFLLSFILSIMIYFSLPEISRFIANYTAIYFKDSIIFKDKLLDVYYVFVQGRFPTYKEALAVLLVSIIILILIRFVNTKPNPFVIWFAFVLLITIISSLFFLFLGYFFPYTVKDLSLLYILLQVGVFLFIPLVLGASLAILNFSWWVSVLNMIVVFLTLIYAFIFSIVRYIVFLYVLKHFSYLWAANLYFSFGPLFDMVYISAFYSFYLSLLSKYISRGVVFWKWIF